MPLHLRLCHSMDFCYVIDQLHKTKKFVFVIFGERVTHIQIEY